MKKLSRPICLILLFSLLCALCACRQTSPPPSLPPSGRLCCTVRLLTGGREKSYALVFENGVCSLTDENGFIFQTGREDCALISGDLELPFERSLLPDRGMLFEALSLPAGAELLKSERENADGTRDTVYTLVGQTENFIYQSDSSGRLLRVDGEGVCPFTARFSY